jgi:hypothetical protein
MFKNQELGETVDAMMADDMKEVESIINDNPKGLIYIVIHHKPTKHRMQSGEQVLVRVCKKYDKKPQPLLGTIILTVKDGDILDTQVNLHDMPIDEARLAPLLGLEETPVVQQGRRDIAGAYAYNTI